MNIIVAIILGLRVLQNASKCTISKENMPNISEEVAQPPSQTLPPLGGGVGVPHPQTPPSFGASIGVPPTLNPIQTKFLDTDLIETEKKTMALIHLALVRNFRNLL